jgi:formate-dependent nitrite reductase membrane component NrfD
MLFAKSGIELIILSVAYQQNQLQYPLTWFLLVMMVLTAGMQLFYLNKGLKLCDNLILVPLSFCAFNVSCLFNGLVYYDQWDRLRWYQIIFVVLGVIITVYGVVLLSWNSSAQLSEEEEERDALLADDESNDEQDYR